MRPRAAATPRQSVANSLPAGGVGNGTAGAGKEIGGSCDGASAGAVNVYGAADGSHTHGVAPGRSRSKLCVVTRLRRRSAAAAFALVDVSAKFLGHSKPRSEVRTS